MLLYHTDSCYYWKKIDTVRYDFTWAQGRGIQGFELTCCVLRHYTHEHIPADMKLYVVMIQQRPIIKEKENDRDLH